MLFKAIDQIDQFGQHSALEVKRASTKVTLEFVYMVLPQHIEDNHRHECKKDESNGFRNRAEISKI